MDYVTAQKSFSTVLPIQMSSRTSKSSNCSNHIQSKCGQENDHVKAARNATSNQPYPRRPKHPSPTTHSRTRLMTTVLHLDSGQSSIKLRCRTENVYAEGYRTIQHSCEQNIHTPTFSKTLIFQETENRLNANAPSTVSNQNTSLPLSVSSFVGEDG